MFNLNLKLRDSDKFVVPRGPNFEFCRNFTADIDGTKIFFKTPKHSPVDQNIKPVISDAIKKLGQPVHYSNHFSENDAQRGFKEHWMNHLLFKHSWGYFGPWFTGPKAELRMSFSILKLINYPESTSIFHPRSFEKVIGDRLTYVYERHIDVTQNNRHTFTAPSYWKPLQHLPVIATHLQAEEDELYNNPTVIHHVFFPIADDQLASIYFSPSRLLAKTRTELNKLISEQPMLDLMENIINSIELELSPEAQAQQKAALEGLEDTSLVSHFPPLKWGPNEEEGNIQNSPSQLLDM